MENQGSWGKHLPLVEFSYNNSYQESLKMAPFELLYGHRCRTLIFGPDLVDEVEATIHHIQNNLKVAKSHQESYANKRHQPL
jgi:hypothetical protein